LSGDGQLWPVLSQILVQRVRLLSDLVEEGAFVLGRAAQSTEALRVAGELCADATRRALDA